jgi:hypothetical protein
MSSRFIAIALLKGACFVVPLLLISMALKLTFPYVCKPVPCHEIPSTRENDRPAFYFVGTSRVQQGISPAVLKNDLPDDNFVNLGLSNSSFLYSCKAASNLLKQRSGKKVIFIELTELSLAPSDSYYFLLTPEDVGEVIRQHLSIQCTPEDLSGLLFYVFSIHSDLKKVVYSGLNLDSQREIGFVEDLHDYAGTLDMMLTPQSFTTKTSVSPSLLNAYGEIIDQLRKEAAEDGSEIQFMLPLTINKRSEFHVDMAVFAQLPEDLKWSYSGEFLSAMKDRQYLSDAVHLSAEGAVRNSQELSKFIKTRFSAETTPGPAGGETKF